MQWQCSTVNEPEPRLPAVITLLAELGAECHSHFREETKVGLLQPNGLPVVGRGFCLVQLEDPRL